MSRRQKNIFLKELKRVQKREIRLEQEAMESMLHLFGLLCLANTDIDCFVALCLPLCLILTVILNRYCKQMVITDVLSNRGIAISWC